MNCCRVLIIVLALILSFLRTDTCRASEAEVSDSASSLISIRAGQHPRFFRIVLEGPEETLSKAHVKQKEKDIKISFDDVSIDVEKTYTPFAFKTERDSVVVSLPKKGDMKIFSLKEPSRLVVDVYPLTNKKKTVLLKRKYARLITGPENNEAAVSVDTNIKTSGGEHILEIQRTPTVKSRMTKDDRSAVLLDEGYKRSDTKQRTPQDDRSIALEEKNMAKMTGTRNTEERYKRETNRNKKAVSEYAGLDGIICPEKFKELCALLESGNAIDNLTKLPGLEPEGTEELALYYYFYGEGYNAGGEYIKATDNLRLAYIYADNNLKELALFRMAKVYEMMGLYHEARSNYLVFINEFPVSKRREKAYLGLAICSQKLNLLYEAVQYYDKAGSDAVTLFHKANALQQLKRAEEARKIYDAANKADSSYSMSSFDSMTALSGTQKDYHQNDKKNLTSKIISILEPIVGKGKVKAMVSAMPFKEINSQKIGEVERDIMTIVVSVLRYVVPLLVAVIFFFIIVRLMIKSLSKKHPVSQTRIVAKGSPLDSLKLVDARTLSNFLVTEYPQTIALILCLLEPEQAADVLELLPEDLRDDVTIRVAKTQRIPESALQEIEEVLKVQLDIKGNSDGKKLKGTKVIADILNYCRRSTERNVLKRVEIQNSELAESIREMMIVFEDIEKIDDRGIQMIIKDVNTEELSMALKTASDTIKEKIFASMSQGSVKLLKEDMEAKGRVKLSDVEAAQQNIARIAKKLDEEGKIIIAGRGEEKLIV